ncbi:hypothetical protein GALL_385480 [mine drainage metagenome]|uniref:Uncharacterized protein n=1 Tax=mine drainage metagenome TaxID=410659 RepID=A0A1J5Q7U3_9ZZZZ
MQDNSLRDAAARVLLGAAALIAAPTGVASAATVQLSTIGSEVLLCRAELRSADGQGFTATPEWRWIVSYERTHFDFGKVLEEVKDHSPHFASLALSCVRRDRIRVGKLPRPDERSYSIELDRFDPLWAIDDPFASPSTPSWYSELPRDGTVVALRIGSTGQPQRPLRIHDAGFWHDADPFGTYIDYTVRGQDWYFVEDDEADD